jgi:hypothetical protein
MQQNRKIPCELLTSLESGKGEKRFEEWKAAEEAYYIFLPRRKKPSLVASVSGTAPRKIEHRIESSRSAETQIIRLPSPRPLRSRYYFLIARGRGRSLGRWSVFGKAGLALLRSVDEET